MKKILLTTALLLSPVLAQAGAAGSAIPAMMDKFTAEGGSNFSAEAGKKMWSTAIPFTDKDGMLQKDRSCATCHGTDLTKSGKHKKTGKVIAAMAISVPFVMVEEKDIPRFSKAKKIRKWFKRNCKWTYGRECTAQEKGDFLAYFKGL
ncbi:MAG: DUF1924 domain-containing protein [Ghiorsea sp.]